MGGEVSIRKREKGQAGELLWVLRRLLSGKVVLMGRTGVRRVLMGRFVAGEEAFVGVREEKEEGKGAGD